jgi:hypothetical protein
MTIKSKTKGKRKRPPNRYPRGWNRKTIQELAEHYEQQTEEDAAAEDEAAFRDPQHTVMLVPRALVPRVQKLLAAHAARR